MRNSQQARCEIAEDDITSDEVSAYVPGGRGALTHSAIYWYILLDQEESIVLDTTS